jgi:hypothetical protein
LGLNNLNSGLDFCGPEAQLTSPLTPEVSTSETPEAMSRPEDVRAIAGTRIKRLIKAVPTTLQLSRPVPMGARRQSYLKN